MLWQASQYRAKPRKVLPTINWELDDQNAHYLIAGRPVLEAQVDQILLGAVRCIVHLATPFKN
jgi:hypothetical protein